MALLEAGISPDTPALIKAGRWLISKQITKYRGDWAVKNPNAEPGGWSFEFKNDCFPDVDDTIEVVSVLQRLAIPEQEKEPSIKKGIAWLLSMQNDDGGWGAFDKNQTLNLVNKIPFSDHAACLDPSSPDITGRMLELLASRGMTVNDPPIARAIDYLVRKQESFGGWFARWGINYIYGTWCVLTGLAELGWNPAGTAVRKATNWLKQIQNEDGGFGESPESYPRKTYVRWKESVPSQTAWGLMGLVAAGEVKSDEARRASLFLINRMNENGSWDETAYTGTGFPGHFYIRYHGYRHFFPILALARYNRQI
jgi:squalene-hopene/tetraprenyl-beta-curcumene cyclase